MHDTYLAGKEARDELVEEAANFDDELASKVISPLTPHLTSHLTSPHHTTPLTSPHLPPLTQVIEWESYDADPHSLQQALRRITLANGAPPGEGGPPRALVTLLGSALRAVGVRPLLDAVVDYLPAPDDRPLPEARAFGANFSGLVFKVNQKQNKQKLFLA